MELTSDINKGARWPSWGAVAEWVRGGGHGGRVG